MDHPRIRGEHGLSQTERLLATGSSPHTRGALRCWPARGDRAGIIPAYAGSTLDPFDRRRIQRDHPRIRGEHLSPFAHFLTVNGSSPHTRGAHGERVEFHGQGGIIPAYAGSTRAPAGNPPRASDHPRIRGEHSRRRGAGLIGWGSSPHTRGARLGVAAAHHAVRIIPAYAGSTWSAVPKP